MANKTFCSFLKPFYKFYFSTFATPAQFTPLHFDIRATLFGYSTQPHLVGPHNHKKNRFLHFPDEGNQNGDDQDGNIYLHRGGKAEAVVQQTSDTVVEISHVGDGHLLVEAPVVCGSELEGGNAVEQLTLDG